MFTKTSSQARFRTAKLELTCKQKPLLTLSITQQYRSLIPYASERNPQYLEAPIAYNYVHREQCINKSFR